MARMIPPLIPATCRSNGEREVFTRLRDEQAARNWTVLHSLHIANHLRQVEGEADFLIIVPGLGVLCLEVKGCYSLKRVDGLWYYGRETRGDPRGPFKQASEAMHSLRKQVLQARPDLAQVPFWSAVAFPFIEFTSDSDEWHSWQVIDARRFSRQPLASLVSSILRSARIHLSSQPTAAWFRDSDRLPSEQQSAAIARILRPSFEFAEKAPDRRARQKAEVLRFTEEQFAALDSMEGNRRVLFTGPAGTGKTVLAIEALRRAAISGKVVLKLCFNRLLGRSLSQHPVTQHENVVVSTFHQYLLGVSGTIPPRVPSDGFWKEKLPDAASSKLLEGHGDLARFDVLIVDEIQDLLSAPYIDVMDLVLRDGLARGRWLLFGDFERQMLYGQDKPSLDELMGDRFGAFARCSLRVNCRNTPRVATLTHLLGKLDPNYSRVLRPDDRVEPDIHYYATPSQQRKKLRDILERLHKGSFSSQDIVILSPKAGSRCAAAAVTEAPWSERLAPYEQCSTNQIPYTTIHSYKGLESPVVIVTDIEHLSGEHFCSLFYVAATRSLEQLYLLVHETAKSAIVRALVGSGSS